MLSPFQKSRVVGNRCPHLEVFYTKQGLFKREIHYRCKLANITLYSLSEQCYKANSMDPALYQLCRVYCEHKTAERWKRSQK